MLKNIKILTLVTLITTILATTGCSSKETTKTNEFIPVNEFVAVNEIINADNFNDLTVQFEDFNPTNFSNLQYSGTNASLPSGYFNMEDNWNSANNIVYGSVSKIRYFDEFGLASTFYDFKIENVYKGDLNIGDIITVDTPGGYVRLEKEIENFGKSHYEEWTNEEIKNTIYFNDFEGSPAPKEGEKYMLFLKEPENNIPDNLVKGLLYYESGIFRGRYYYNQDNRLERYCPSPGFYHSPEKLEIFFKNDPDPETAHLRLKNEDPTYTFEEIDYLLKMKATK